MRSPFFTLQLDSGHPLPYYFFAVITPAPPHKGDREGDPEGDQHWRASRAGTNPGSLAKPVERRANASSRRHPRPERRVQSAAIPNHFSRFPRRRDGASSRLLQRGRAPPGPLQGVAALRLHPPAPPRQRFALSPGHFVIRGNFINSSRVASHDRGGPALPGPARQSPGRRDLALLAGCWRGACNEEDPRVKDARGLAGFPRFRLFVLSSRQQAGRPAAELQWRAEKRKLRPGRQKAGGRRRPRGRVTRAAPAMWTRNRDETMAPRAHGSRPGHRGVLSGGTRRTRRRRPRLTRCAALRRQMTGPCLSRRPLHQSVKAVSFFAPPPRRCAAGRFSRRGGGPVETSLSPAGNFPFQKTLHAPSAALAGACRAREGLRRQRAFRPDSSGLLRDAPFPYGSAQGAQGAGARQSRQGGGSATAVRRADTSRAENLNKKSRKGKKAGRTPQAPRLG